MGSGPDPHHAPFLVRLSFCKRLDTIYLKFVTGVVGEHSIHFRAAFPLVQPPKFWGDQWDTVCGTEYAMKAEKRM